MLGLFTRRPAVGPPELIVQAEKEWPPFYYEVHSVATEQPKDPCYRHIGSISFVSFDEKDAVKEAERSEREYRRKQEPFTAIVAEWPTSRERFMDRRDMDAFQDFFRLERVIGIPPMPRTAKWRDGSWWQTKTRCGYCHEYKSSHQAGGDGIWGPGICNECRARLVADPELKAAYLARLGRERDDGIALNGWPVDFADRNELGYVRFAQEHWDRRLDYPVHLRDGKGLIATGQTQLQFPDGHWAEWRTFTDAAGHSYMTADAGNWDEPIPGEQWWVKLHREPWRHEAPRPEYRIVWPAGYPQ